MFEFWLFRVLGDVEHRSGTARFDLCMQYVQQHVSVVDAAVVLAIRLCDQSGGRRRRVSPSDAPLSLGGARQGERSLDPKRAGVQRHPSGLQNDPDDSVHSGGSNMGSTGQNEATKSHLSNSVYAWACGEKAEGEREEPKTSDAVIGWMILLVSAYPPCLENHIVR